MLPVDIFVISTRAFKKNSLRTILTVAGIGVGIGSIFFLVSLGYGMQKVVLSKIATEDSLLSIDVSAGGDNNENIVARKNLSEIENIEGVEKISPTVIRKIKIYNKEVATEAELNIVGKYFFKLEGVIVDEGKLFKEKGDKKEAVVSVAVLDLLHINKNSFRDKEISIRLDGKNEEKFNLVGLINDESTPRVYISGQVVAINQFANYNKVKVKVKNEEQIELVRAELVSNGYAVAAVSDTVAQTRNVFRVIKVILLLFGMLALAVSAIGMFNTMTVSLLERMHEIAIMKALGASVVDIWSMFLAESVIIGFLGGISGIIIGICSSELFNFLLNIVAVHFGGEKIDLFYSPVWFFAFIIIFSVAVGFATGFYPAKRAASINPLEALRYK